MSKFGKDRSVDPFWLSVPLKYCMSARGADNGSDKEFVIIELYGRKSALCAWRNTERCNVGKTFICPIIKKNKKYYVLYKNQQILLSDSYGWVY